MNIFKNNDFIGLALDGNVIRIAHLKKKGDILQLRKLDKISLVKTVESSNAVEPAAQNGDDSLSDSREPKQTDDIFGFESTTAETSSDEDEIDFEELEAEAEAAESAVNGDSLDMVDEAKQEHSNAFVLYNIFTQFGGEKSIQLGLNVPAGDTIYQVFKDIDYNEVKKKDLVDDLESKLESIYGEAPTKDHYSYFIREDGSLILASAKEEAQLLTMLNEAREYYNGKLHVRSIFPDEAALASLIERNYTLESSEVTAVIQFGTKNCRFFFMKGEEIVHVAPIIQQGVNSNNILNKIFSKILFELDTGKISGVDQIIIANNLAGPEAVKFFEQNFPNINVSEIEYNNKLLKHAGTDKSTLNSFTTAIAAAWAASEKMIFQNLHFYPHMLKNVRKFLN